MGDLSEDVSIVWIQIFVLTEYLQTKEVKNFNHSIADLLSAYCLISLIWFAVEFSKPDNYTLLDLIFGFSFQTQFVVDEVSTIIKEAVESTIGGNAYQQNKVSQWTSLVVESCLGSLTKLQKPFKYIGKV